MNFTCNYTFFFQFQVLRIPLAKKFIWANEKHSYKATCKNSGTLETKKSYPKHHLGHSCPEPFKYTKIKESSEARFHPLLVITRRLKKFTRGTPKWR